MGHQGPRPWSSPGLPGLIYSARLILVGQAPWAWRAWQAWHGSPSQGLASDGWCACRDHVCKSAICACTAPGCIPTHAVQRSNNSQSLCPGSSVHLPFQPSSSLFSILLSPVHRGRISHPKTRTEPPRLNSLALSHRTLYAVRSMLRSMLRSGVSECCDFVLPNATRRNADATQPSLFLCPSGFLSTLFVSRQKSPRSDHSHCPPYY